MVVVISVAGSLAAVLMAAPRVYFAMARDGIFFASFGAVDSRRDVPARATVVQATLASALALTGSFDQILSYFMVPTLVFLALTVAGIFVLHHRDPGRPVAGTAGLSGLSLALLDADRDRDCSCRTRAEIRCMLAIGSTGHVVWGFPCRELGVSGRRILAEQNGSSPAIG